MSNTLVAKETYRCAGILKNNGGFCSSISLLHIALGYIMGHA